MNVNSINGNNMGLQSLKTGMNQGMDSVSKNLQSQIAGAQKQLQELGDNKEMSLEEKMKKRQELQQQINDMQNQLRRHQIEQRKESRQKNSSVDDMLGGKRQTRGTAKGGTGMSSASMQAIISADASMNQVKVQGAVKSHIEDNAGVLRAEIKQDGGRGGDTSKKEEELAGIEAKAQNIETSQMNAIADINNKLKEASEADKKNGKKEKAEKIDDINITGETHESEQTYETVDVMSEGVSVNSGVIAKSSGNNVDVSI